MEQRRQQAYRYLLYQAMLDIRPIAWMSLGFLNPFGWRRTAAHVRRAGVIAVCRQAGHRIVIVVGHPGYYPRFGFSPELAAPLQSEYAGEAFMALELVPGALDGVTGEVKYPPPFGAF